MLCDAFPASCALLLLVSCQGDPTLNQVQESAREAASWFVDVSAADGFLPDCKAIPRGDTVQWTHLDPAVPANVTSIGQPKELYSPNLQGPYTEWTHTFSTRGWFPYFDTNSGDPGRPVVDAYYGTVTYVGASDEAHRGAICVRRDGDRAEGSCCCTDLDCEIGLVCDGTNTCTS